MAQEVLNLGTVANDRTGDTWRAGGTKINNNFTELFAHVDSVAFVFVSLESEFPTQDATTITLEAQTVYVTTAAISTAKRFIVEDAAVLTSFNILGPILEYTGSGSMFTGSDSSFTIRDIQISHPSAQGFDFTDTIGNIFLYINLNVRTVSGLKYGTFNNMQTVFITGSSTLDMGDGVTLTGANQSVVSFNQFFMATTSATFIGVDLGTAIALTWEFTDLILVGPTGSIGIKGAANNANVVSGSEADVVGGNFSGIDIPLSGVTIDDIRWKFANNSGIRDTLEDALISLTNNTTETTISVVDTPVKVAGTFVCERASFFTCDTNGRATFDGERSITVPIDITSTIISASGVNKDIHVYLALNGAIIANSGAKNRIGATDPGNTSIAWQLELVTNDYLEIWVENNTDTVNLIVEDAVLRVR